MYTRERLKTKRLVLLSTGTEDDEDIGVAELDRKHRNKGCLSIGFHYVIRRDGMVETGRPLTTFGNYRRDYNEDSVYVCLVGKVGNFTKEQALVWPDIKDEILDMWPGLEIIDRRS